MEVDPGKSKVKVNVPRMFRIRAIDHDDERLQSKEYLSMKLSYAQRTGEAMILE
jgi:hypothetical protein